WRLRRTKRRSRGNVCVSARQQSPITKTQPNRGIPVWTINYACVKNNPRVMIRMTPGKAKMNSKHLMNELTSAGWKLTRVRGSHHVFKHSDLPQMVVVPHPRKDLPPGTAHAIRKHAGLVS